MPWWPSGSSLGCRRSVRSVPLSLVWPRPDAVHGRRARRRSRGGASIDSIAEAPRATVKRGLPGARRRVGGVGSAHHGGAGVDRALRSRGGVDCRMCVPSRRDHRQMGMMVTIGRPWHSGPSLWPADAPDQRADRLRGARSAGGRRAGGPAAASALALASATGAVVRFVGLRTGIREWRTASAKSGPSPS